MIKVVLDKDGYVVDIDTAMRVLHGRSEGLNDNSEYEILEVKDDPSLDMLDLTICSDGEYIITKSDSKRYYDGFEGIDLDDIPKPEKTETHKAPNPTVFTLVNVIIIAILLSCLVAIGYCVSMIM